MWTLKSSNNRAPRKTGTPGGALRRGPLPTPARLAHLAWAVRPLSGFRRTAFLAVLCGALLAGQVPFTAGVAPLLAMWLPAFLATSLGLALLSGWTLRPGDRTRWSLHTLGPVWSSLRHEPVARPGGGDLAHPQVEPRRIRPEPRLAELADGIGATGDDADGERVPVRRLVRRLAAEVRVSEERVDRRGEHPHQLLVWSRTARRGRLLTGRTEASVLTSMALPSGRAICRA